MWITQLLLILPSRPTLLDAEDGEVFVCGQNHRGQLGLGHLTDITTLQRCLSLTQTVTNVTCGWDFTLFLTGETLDTGNVWWCWQFEYLFLITLTDSGRVLSCGSNAFGQLGIGQEPAYTAEVQIVEVIFFLIQYSTVIICLDQFKLFGSQSLKAAVVSVAAGLRHSLAVTGN